jgi:hypothetical protein
MSRVAGALLLGLISVGLVRADQETDPAKRLAQLAIERRDAARKTYEVTWANYRDGMAAGEMVYRWSLRWLEAERQLSERPVDQVTAFKDHLERMYDLEQLVRRVMARAPGQATIDQVSAAEYYRVEAEMWLLQAKEEKKKP